MSPNLTPCECSPTAFPFYCARHDCTKIERWHELCRTEPECFANWENGAGHGQVRAPEYSSGARQSSGGDQLAPPNSGEFGYEATRPPALLHRVWNLARAVATHVAGGCHSVATEDYAARLSVCEACPERRENVCLRCGCYLTLKAHWRAMECPMNKWPPLTEAARDGPQPVSPLRKAARHSPP
jgi:hypothetical protein